MTVFEPLLKTALHRAASDADDLTLDTVDHETDILAAVDSFTVVNLLLESESMLEASTGRYVSLANEHIFDASKSPLLRWGDWVAYVESRHIS